MNRETAEMLSNVATQCTRQLHGLIPILKERLDAEEYEKFAKGIALASSYLLTEITNPVLTLYPELKSAGAHDDESSK